MNICSALLLAVSIGAQQNARPTWRDTLASELQAAYRASGMPVSVSRDSLYAPSGGISGSRVVNVHWDALHRRSVILLARKDTHPLVAQSSELLPAMSEGRASVIQAPTPLMVRAGESCETTISDGRLHMKFQTKALNSARMGQRVRVEMTDGRRKIFSAVVVGRALVEVLP